MTWLWLRTRPFSFVVALMSMLLALTVGCGRSDFEDDLYGDGAVSDSGADGFDGGDETILPDAPEPDVPLPDGGTLVALAVEPASQTLALGDTQFFTARGLYSDGSTRDVTTFATWSSNDESIVAIGATTGFAKAVGPGNTRVRATYLGFIAEADVIVKGGTIVSLRIDPGGATVPGGGNQFYTATAIYSDGSSVDVTTATTFTIDDPGLGSFMGSVFTASFSSGSSTIRGTFMGLTGFAKITVLGGLKLDHIEVSPFGPSVGVGVSVNLFATAIYTDGSKSDITASAMWSVADPKIVSIAPGFGTEIATGVSPGVTTVTAAFSGLTGSTTITVTGSTLTSIVVSPSAATIAPAGTAILTATANYSDGSKIDVTATALWSSSDTGIATVGGGKVTGVAAGTATITASLGGKSGTATITVSPAKIVSITVSPNPATAPLGSKVKLTAKASYSDGSTRDVTNDVTWSTDDASVATVSNAAADKGTITPIKVGSTTAHAKLDGIDGAATINVTAAVVTTITVSPNPLSMISGTKQFVKASATYSDGSVVDVSTTCTWSTADAKVATVSNGTGSQGQVTATGAGTTTVTCTLSGVTGSATINVTGSTLDTVSVSPINPTCKVGDTLQFQATAITTGGTSTNVTFTAAWSTSAPTIVGPLMAPGRYRCLAKGTSTITATYMGKSGTSVVTVTDAVPVSIEVDPVDASIAVSTTQQYQAIAIYSDGTTRNVTNLATWTSSNATVAAISTAGPTRGRATANAAGTTTIKATWSGITGSTTLTVTDATVTSISITPGSVSVPTGVTYPYQATAIYSDGSSKDVTALATWTSSDATIVAVSNAAGSKGQAKTLASGSATVKATYSGVTGSASVTVTTATLKTVQVTPFNPKLPVGYGVRMTATAIWTDGFTANVTAQATWSSSNTSAATVSNALGSKGRVTPVAAGTTSITATYNGVSGSTTVTVTSATLASIAVAPNPASIAIGGQQQLTATGTFSDASTLDVTEFVAWSSSDTTVADVSNAADTKGVAYGFKAGSVTITAQKGTVSGTASATVK